MDNEGYKPSPKNILARAKENAKALKYDIEKDANGHPIQFEDLPIAKMFMDDAERQLIAEYEAEHAAELAAEAARRAEQEAREESERREQEMKARLRAELIAELKAELGLDKK